MLVVTNVMEEAAASSFYSEVGEKRFFWNDGNLLQYYSKKNKLTLHHHTSLYSGIFICLHFCTILFIIFIVLHVNMYRRHGARCLFLNSRQFHAIEIYCFITAFFIMRWTMMTGRTGKWYKFCLQQMMAMPLRYA